MSEFQQHHVFVIKIESIEFPKYLPLFYFISWRSGTLTGQTKMIQATAQLIQIDDSFEIPIPNVYEINFSLQGKTPLGALFRIGEANVKISEALGDMKEHHENFDIDSESNKFKIRVSFKLKVLDQTMEYDPQFSVLLHERSNLTTYGELVKQIPYSFDESKSVSLYYSDDGLLAQLCQVGSQEITTETTQTLHSLLPDLQSKIEKSKLEFEILKNSGFLMMYKSPLFLLLDNSEIINGDQAREEAKAKIPLLGLYLSSIVAKAYDGFDIQSILLKISNLITYIDTNKNTSDHWKIYLITSSLFFMQYIVMNHLEENFSYISKALKCSTKNAIIYYIENCLNDFSKIWDDPNGVHTKFVLKRKFFNNFGFPKKIFDIISVYIYSSLDCNAVSGIVSDLENSLNIEANKIIINEYKRLFPDYQWELLTSLQFILEKYVDIYKSKIKLSDIKPQIMAGEYLKRVLCAFCRVKENKMNEKKVDALFKKNNNSDVEPSVKNIHEWAENELVFINNIDIPSNIQSYIDDISNIMKRLDLMWKK